MRQEHHPPYPSSEVDSGVEATKLSLKELRSIAYVSFEDAQGDQALQAHATRGVISRMIEQGYTFDMREIAELRNSAISSLMPKDHKQDLHPEEDVIAIQRKAQMEFWWHLILDAVHEYSNNYPELLPTRGSLEEVGASFGGTPDMSSFTAKEYGLLADAYDRYNADLKSAGSMDILAQGWLPRLIEVELKWQGKEQEDEEDTRANGRPRAKPENKFMSVWRKCSLAAHNRAATGKPISVRDQMYIDMAKLMEWAEENEPESELVQNYRELLTLYNHNNPSDEPVSTLYR